LIALKERACAAQDTRDPSALIVTLDSMTFQATHRIPSACQTFARRTRVAVTRVCPIDVYHWESVPWEATDTPFASAPPPTPEDIVQNVPVATRDIQCALPTRTVCHHVPTAPATPTTVSASVLATTLVMPANNVQPTMAEKIVGSTTHPPLVGAMWRPS